MAFLEEMIGQYKILILENKEFLEKKEKKMADATATKAFKLAQKIKKIGPEGRGVLASLMREQNPYLQNAGAVHSIVLPEYREQALRILKRNKELPGYPGMDAIVYLAAWDNQRDLFN